MRKEIEKIIDDNVIDFFGDDFLESKKEVTDQICSLIAERLEEPLRVGFFGFEDKYINEGFIDNLIKELKGE